MSTYVLRFDDLNREGHGFAFPCDKNGTVDTVHMSDNMYSNYLRAMKLLGIDFATPKVMIAD